MIIMGVMLLVLVAFVLGFKLGRHDRQIDQDLAEIQRDIDPR